MFAIALSVVSPPAMNRSPQNAVISSFVNRCPSTSALAIFAIWSLRSGLSTPSRRGAIWLQKAAFAFKPFSRNSSDPDRPIIISVTQVRNRSPSPSIPKIAEMTSTGNCELNSLTSETSEELEN